ncbi:malto-oligosyltrehalose synthase [Microbacterium sp. NPDC019599]|uniref:malto-oligosyltrehalose synthase n=1 Tax=Microbacterium sp. NPDC019599 TaxID=3154690 RepID=UPI0033F16614
MHPSSTYRLQLRRAFDLDAAAAVTGYLRDLGVGWAYLSPLLQSADGSDHGYDVVDPTRVDSARGGPEALARFSSAARRAGLGILVDIVPNHMGIARQAENPWWWDVLLRGRGSPHAGAFDIDWDLGGGRIRLAILGSELEEALASGELTADPRTGRRTPFGELRYFDHVLPLAQGTAPEQETTDAASLRGILDRQHWELMLWRRQASELNYRRFFAVTSLAGVRVEVPEVFEASHAEILRWVHEGLVDGLRIDHPDGLLDPGGYLERLADASDGVPVFVEKILEHSATGEPESLPAWWEADGTTGYDALAEIDRVLVDPEGEAALDALDARLRADTGLPDAVSYAELSHAAKRTVAETIQGSEVARLVRCLPEPVDRAAHALAELLACFPVYRSYLPAGVEHLEAAAADASARRPELAASIGQLVPVLRDPAQEVARRFQQTTGPVMAKGVEDAAFYRYTRLGTLTEVGGDPSLFALPVPDFHAAFARRQASWPGAMTALSTHDTKRGEDVRARLSVLAELPERWAEILTGLRGIATTGHGPFDSLLWQAIVGAWPATPERLHVYAQKAAREAGERTGWWDPDPAFEARVHGVVDAAFGRAVAMVNEFVREIRAFGWSNSLSAKLLQLAGPGVPDLYQGSELWETSLADPDNRRAVDFDARRTLLAEVDASFERGEHPTVDAAGAAKLLVVSRTLRLRRDRPDLFTRYTPMTVVGEASDHAVAFDRGGALAVATRLPAGLARRGGWGDTALLRHSGPTVDVLTGRRFEGSRIALAELLAIYPVALLATEEDT